MNEPSCISTATATVILTDARNPRVDHYINGERPPHTHAIRVNFTIYARPRKIRRRRAA